MAHWNDTRSHGYLVLNPDELKRIPDFARRGSYEEDAEWSIAVLALPEILDQRSFGCQPGTRDKWLESARARCRDNYPDIFQKLTGEVPTPENSRKLAEEKFDEDNKNNWVVYSARGDWADGCPAGMVECWAQVGGRKKFLDEKESRLFYIPKSDYEKRGPFGYVVPAALVAASEITK